MRFFIAKDSLSRNLRDALRRCGYFGLKSKQTGQESYVKRLSKEQFYPRFHIYIDDTGDNWQFNLHLDQKKASYEGHTAHSGEYEDPLVEEEAERVKSIISN